MLHARKDYDRIQDPAGLIPEDEPVFLLRAQDSCAVPTLMFWAGLAEAYGASNEMIEGIRAHALKMRAWQGRVACKTPDAPPGAMRYTGK